MKTTKTTKTTKTMKTMIIMIIMKKMKKMEKMEKMEKKRIIMAKMNNLEVQVLILKKLVIYFTPYFLVKVRLIIHLIDIYELIVLTKKIYFAIWENYYIT